MLITKNPDIVICGAGIAGISAAYYLAVKHGVRNITLVDSNAPLSLTSDHSTECYRNWWPGPGDAMVAFMNRSLDLIEDMADISGNLFNLNRRGYLYMTADPEKIPGMRASAEVISSLGAGPLRIHQGRQDDPEYVPAASEGYAGQPSGADLLLDPHLIQAYFPYLTDRVVAALHVRRAGWLSAQQLGMYLLQQARSYGVRILSGRITGVQTQKDRVISILLEDGSALKTGCFINAAGPFIKEVGHLLNLDLPVYWEFHQKAAYNDHLSVIDRGAPLLIWNDSQTLPWSEEEREFLTEEEDLRWLTGELPAGLHTRPEGASDSQIILGIWEYHTERVEPIWPLPYNPQYPEIVLRGLTRMLPGLEAYLHKNARPRIDGGYYTKTLENRPLIGETPVRGAYLIGALSGYGIMASCAAGELLAAHITGEPLPSYAAAFSLDRYEDPVYQNMLANWGASGQL